MSTPPAGGRRAAFFLDPTAPMLHPPDLLACWRANPEVRRRAAERAAPWRGFDLGALWRLVFGPRITRSWMVWSDGDCPACRRPVNMYDWVVDAFAAPWKLGCPHCGELFPKNDFAAFHASGLDAAGLFDPQRADRDLLYNLEHPDAGDPLRRFGVDDGEGVPGPGGRWRFVGTYLIYGQWKQLVVDGVECLAAAYAATGEAVYARQAGVLLDRVADVYPRFDFGAQAILYERRGDRGYVSTWHDACEEVQRLALAYDQVRDAIRADVELARFVADRAARFAVPSPKRDGAAICAHIEARILGDTLEHLDKIRSNFPTTDLAAILIETVLHGGAQGDRTWAHLDDVVDKATAVDGLSGEKGLAGYAAIAPRSLARYFALFARGDDGFVPRMLQRHPGLARHWRFHAETWVGQRFYPNVGDSGGPGAPGPRYAGADFDRHGADPLAPSIFTFFGQLYQATGDPLYVQVLHQANDRGVEGLPHDPGHPDPEGFRRQVAQVLETHGAHPRVGSVLKRHWGLAILRAGDDRRAPTVWVDLDSGAPDSIYNDRMDPTVRGRGAHSHADGLNLGLYYRGVDVITDRGYPPVNYGGWDSPHAEWYKRTSAHNTVVVDGLEQATAGAEVLWWLDDEAMRGLCAAAPGLVDGGRCERTLVLVNTGPEDAYLVDVHRVAAGTDHTRFLHATFGQLATHGLRLAPAPDYCHQALLRHTRLDADPVQGWVAEWTIDDTFGLGPPGVQLYLRYVDVTRGAAAGSCEGFALRGPYTERDERWLPTLMQRRQAEAAPLASVFAGVLEPHEGTPAVTAVRRVDAAGADAVEAPVEVEVDLSDGRRDRVVVGLGDAVRVERDGKRLA